MPIIEFIVLFAFLVLASSGWGALVGERAKLPVSFWFMTGFGVLAMLAYLGFFVFLLDAVMGRAISCLIGLGSLGLLAWQVRKPLVKIQLSHPDFWLPLVLLFLYTVSSLLVLHLHGGDPRHALTHQLPQDNILPQILSDRLWYGGPIQTVWGITMVRVDQLGPFFGDWLSSDRPPLQVALHLVCRPFELLGFRPDDVYRLCATLFQATWVPAVYLLARQLQFSRYATGLTLAWFAGSGFFLVHSLFTWPKLLAASLFLGLSLLLYCVRKLPEKNPSALMLLAMLWALALLAHGGILFSLLAVPFLPCAWRLWRMGIPALMGALVVFMLISVPWSAYQKFYDPPGNRLVKWHLAGVIPPDSRGTLETIRDSYAQLTFEQWLDHRKDNVKTTIHWDPTNYEFLSSLEAMRSYFNLEHFFRLSAVIGLLIGGYGVLAMAWLLRKPGGKILDSPWHKLLGMNLVCYLIWITLMFQGDGALVHQASYAMVILFLVIGALGVSKLPMAVGLFALAAQWILYTFTYLNFYPVPVIVNATWYIDLAGYWILIALFAISLWRFLPKAADDLP